MTQKEPSARRGRVEVLRGGSNLATPHRPEEYRGILVVRLGQEWDESIIVPEDGQTFVALGGEYGLGYTSRSGHAAARIVLNPGDRATLVRSGLEAHLAEWRIERA